MTVGELIAALAKLPPELPVEMLLVTEEYNAVCCVSEVTHETGRVFAPHIYGGHPLPDRVLLS